MGGGGLRILGHKKWHVWRRDNIERVLRDEREHAEQQHATREDQRRREQARRAEALRLGDDDHTPQLATHINFFEQEEEAHTHALLTGRHPKQPLNQQQKWAESETLGRHARLPWYAAPAIEARTSRRDDAKRMRSEEALDPLRDMRPTRAREDKEADDDEDERVRRRRDEKKRRWRCEHEAHEQDETIRKRASKKQKTNKKDAVKKKARAGENPDEDSARAMMARLRRERDEREAIERERAERLMRGH